MFYNKINRHYDNGSCYLKAIHNLDLWKPSDYDEKINYYSFVVDRLKIAIAADSHLDFILRLDLDDNTKAWEFFPSYVYFDAMHCESIDLKKKVDVNLSKDIVISSTSKGHRLIKHIVARFDDEYKQTSNHNICFYNYINLGVVLNGRHSTASAIYHRKWFAKADLYDFTKLFSCTSTDGVEWYSITANKEIGFVRDYRYAVLFEAAKRKFQIENSI